jgi:hypothetical protein
MKHIALFSLRTEFALPLGEVKAKVLKSVYVPSGSKA